MLPTSEPDTEPRYLNRELVDHILQGRQFSKPIHPEQKKAFAKFVMEATRLPLTLLTANGTIHISKEPPLFGLPGIRIKSQTSERFVWSENPKEAAYENAAR